MPGALMFPVLSDLLSNSLGREYYFHFAKKGTGCSRCRLGVQAGGSVTYETAVFSLCPSRSSQTFPCVLSFFSFIFKRGSPEAI